MIIVCNFVIITTLIAISYVDWRELKIPDTLVIMVGIFASLAAYSTSPSVLLDGLLAGVIGYCILGGIRLALTRVMRREAMGYGDVKLISAGAIWIGTDWLPQSILFASIAALCFIVVKKISDPSYKFDRPIPFGPSLSLGLMVAKLLSFLSLQEIFFP